MNHERDIINFHILLEAVRNERDISTNQLCMGLCSVSQMYSIQRGDRLPDYLMRNRIMARLGISSEGYEDYVQYDEYIRWTKRQSLINLIEESRWDEAKKLLTELSEGIKKKNKIEQQFLEDMKARILISEGSKISEISKIYERIVKLTVKNKKINGSLLSQVEYYYAITYLYFKYKESDRNKDIIVAELYELLQSIVESPLEGIARAKVLPYAVVKYYEMAKEDINLGDKLWKYSCEAIEVLKKSGRTYYLEDLVFVRKQLLLKHNFGNRISLSLEEEVVSLIIDLKRQYQIKMQNWQNGYIYRDSQVYCIADVILARRRMLGLSRKDLSDGICSERTLERIEAKHSKPQQYILKALFDRMKLEGDYRRNEIITDDINLINMYNRYKEVINQKQYDSAFEYSGNIIKMLDTKYVSNKQVVIRLKNHCDLYTDNIDKERYVSNLEVALKLSTIKELSTCKDYFLTTGEMVLLYNIAKNKIHEKWRREIIDYCLIREDFYLVYSVFSLYELVNDWKASILGNEGMFEESNELSQNIIKCSLRLCRIHGLYRAIANIAWNEYTSCKSPDSILIYNKLLKQCILLCDFSQNKLAEVYRKELK